MSGSARSLSISMFSGLRVASTIFTPEYSKNGSNVSAKLVCNSFMNIASKANAGEGRNEAVPFTIWGKLAHVCAKSMSGGKEWNTIAQLHVYNGRVFYPSINGQPGLPVLDATGQPLTTKKFSYTVSMLTFGEESNKHIADEIQAGIRPMGWNIAGSQEAAAWKAILQQRQAITFDPNLPTYGYAKVRMPQGQNIGAYIMTPAEGNVVAPVAMDTAAAVAATFAGPAPVVAPPAAPAQAAPVVAAGGFVIPGV